MIKKIFIIQSLKTTDAIKSGELLSKKVQNIIEVEFYNVETSIEVYNIIDAIKTEISGNKETYVVHFDCHGNENGIGLFDTKDTLTFIKWEELREQFRELYLITKQKPIISFSSCKGLNVMKLIAQFKPCPYEFITGSLKKIDFQESIDGYELFYKMLNSGETLENSMNSIREKYPNLDFMAFTTQKLVQLAWDNYLKTQISPEKVIQRKRDIINEVVSLKGFITPADIAIIDNGLTEIAANLDKERYFKIFNS